MSMESKLFHEDGSEIEREEKGGMKNPREE